ncbi:DUF7064 domain-containing protein [Mycolicibacterium holsaticum]|uniref:DUF7064 domain-containing protein n=1 Tax=Mycolicibacterium holsaticum TaxID=152142 RepID=A0A1E3RVC4_9MYCO|nr:hypothetical protein [Mycolicibacterium holsaticum]ODQ93810.1 hypothetical protein BHQ17_11835 [Mycolicibacterium holsaticum]
MTDASDDRIQPLADDRPANWSENLILTSFDRSSGLSVYVHMGRMAPEADVWEGVLSVFLPDREHLLVSRTFGSDACRSAASSGNLVFSCDTPLQRWSLRYDGMARRVTSSAAAAAPIADGPVERLRVDLTLDGLHDAWVMNKAALSQQSWGHFHLEQACRVHGHVVVEGSPIPIECTGFRDHTYGARSYGPLTHEAWVNCVFPSGRVIMAMLVEEAGAPPLRTGFVVAEGLARPLTMVAAPALTSAAGLPAAVEVTLETGAKRTTAAVVQCHAMSYTLQAPVGFSLGVSYEDPDSVVLVEGPAIFDWDGEQGFGWLERLRRVRALQRPNVRAPR